MPSSNEIMITSKKVKGLKQSTSIKCDENQTAYVLNVQNNIGIAEDIPFQNFVLETRGVCLLDEN